MPNIVRIVAPAPAVSSETNNSQFQDRKNERRRIIEERNRVEGDWYKTWMAMRGQYPRFLQGRVVINDAKDDDGLYAQALEAANAAAAHKPVEDTQVVIFTDAAMSPGRQTNTVAGVGVAFRRLDPYRTVGSRYPPGDLSLHFAEVTAGRAVKVSEAEALNSTAAETMAIAFAVKVAMVELYRLEARLLAEHKRRKRDEEVERAREARRRLAKKAAKKQRKLEKKERRKQRYASLPKELRRAKKAERKARKAEKKKLRAKKRAARSKNKAVAGQPEHQRTKVTVKIFDDSQGALLMLDGQLPISTPGLRKAAMEAIKQSMELKRRFVDREAASALMDVSLELHWTPGHSKFAPKIQDRAEKEAQWADSCGQPYEWFEDLHGELPACDEPAVSFGVEDIGELPQKPLSTSTSTST
ncbi:hypothetical protein B0T20DRAFT_345697 [Sordaria brevicollis]|uniref:Uncharacterized protein n=1 Tax=Sordaria brevicollis TaxID=83679 RepID=A0AAE0PK60_SORBR|nr:hypothetical protein B0T20DRAFT_345697 [Sordaria brevicollis]